MNNQESIKQLPEYAPKQGLWESIATQLEDDAKESATLSATLLRLPQYDAPEHNWQKIVTFIEEEENENSRLRLALQTLKTYSPEENIWLKTTQDVDNQEIDDFNARKKLSTLPQYEAPNVVWLKILQQLLAEKTAIIRRLKVTRLAAAASVVGLVLTVGFLYLANQKASDSMTYSQTQRTVNDALLQQNRQRTSNDEPLFYSIDDFCATKAIVCEQPHFQQLKSELDELNAAYTSLKDAIGEYNTDENLHQQLLSVELSRTEVLKKIMQQI
jgi:hypothetical protein